MISFLKNQYEQEKEQLMLETSKKLEEYKHRIVNNSDQSKQIAKLDGIIKEFNVQKYVYISIVSIDSLFMIILI